MVKALAQLITTWLQELLELAGLALIAVAVGHWAGWAGALAVVGVGLLLKSLEVDLITREDAP